ncbi:hypothetical protein BaRGS_00038509 [Batillaria attramentaria]|uniref:Uncharacterized protein n=1 Tax=Batillaria attramentaria TaxID=370345 RepID=A0ABD0J5Y4_9CAEN
MGTISTRTICPSRMRQALSCCLGDQTVGPRALTEMEMDIHRQCRTLKRGAVVSGTLAMSALTGNLSVQAIASVEIEDTYYAESLGLSLLR